MLELMVDGQLWSICLAFKACVHHQRNVALLPMLVVGGGTNLVLKWR
jgi:hypothetical protein